MMFESPGFLLLMNLTIFELYGCNFLSWITHFFKQSNLKLLSHPIRVQDIISIYGRTYKQYLNQFNQNIYLQKAKMLLSIPILIRILKLINDLWFIPMLLLNSSIPIPIIHLIQKFILIAIYRVWYHINTRPLHIPLPCYDSYLFPDIDALLMNHTDSNTDTALLILVLASYLYQNYINIDTWQEYTHYY